MEGKGKDWNVSRGIKGLIEGDISWAEDAVPEFNYYLYQLEDLVESLPEMTVSRLKIYIKALRVSRAGNDEEFYDRLVDYARELISSRETKKPNEKG